MSETRLLAVYVEGCMECPVRHQGNWFGDGMCAHPHASAKLNGGKVIRQDMLIPSEVLRFAIKGELHHRRWSNGLYIETGSPFPPSCPLKVVEKVESIVDGPDGEKK